MGQFEHGPLGLIGAHFSNQQLVPLFSIDEWYLITVIIHSWKSPLQYIINSLVIWQLSYFKEPNATLQLMLLGNEKMQSFIAFNHWSSLGSPSHPPSPPSSPSNQTPHLNCNINNEGSDHKNRAVKIRPWPCPAAPIGGSHDDNPPDNSR
jgi:hypothetical protein